MAMFDREIDHQQDDLVRESLKRLQPGLSFEEWYCVERLACRRPLRKLFQFSRPPGVEVWDLEQLDRRGWVEAMELDLQPEDARQEGLYKGRGPAFHPLFNGRRDGRPDWPSIHTSIAWASDKPTAWYNRQNACIRLTGRGQRVAEVMAMEDLPELGIFDRTAYALQRISAGWRGRDQIASRWLAVGISTAQTHYEFEIRDRAMRSAAVAASTLEHELIPKLALHIDPSLRDELRALVRELDPMSEKAKTDEGYPVERWRQSWGEIGRDDKIDSLASMLFEMEPRDAPDSPSGTEPLSAGSIEIKFPNHRTGKWFSSATGDVLSSDRLRKAASRGTLTESRLEDGVWIHSITEVIQKHRDAAKRIIQYLASESGQPGTAPDKS